MFHSITIPFGAVRPAELRQITQRPARPGIIYFTTLVDKALVTPVRHGHLFGHPDLQHVRPDSSYQHPVNPWQFLEPPANSGNIQAEETTIDLVANCPFQAGRFNVPEAALELHRPDRQGRRVQQPHHQPCHTGQQQDCRHRHWRNTQLQRTLAVITTGLRPAPVIFLSCCHVLSDP